MMFCAGDCSPTYYRINDRSPTRLMDHGRFHRLPSTHYRPQATRSTTTRVSQHPLPSTRHTINHNEGFSAPITIYSPRRHSQLSLWYYFHRGSHSDNFNYLYRQEGNRTVNVSKLYIGALYCSRAIEKRTRKGK